MKQELWLAEVTRDEGNHQLVRLLDGPHSDAEGVAMAKELFNRLGFARKYQNLKLVRVSVEEIGASAERVNDEAVKTLNGIGLV
jgi:hypothetical protein